VFVAIEGGFHGKLVGSLQVTHNPGFRQPFQGLGAHGRFVGVDRVEDVVAQVEAEQPYALDLVVAEGVVTVERRPVPTVAGFLVEPIQGEGGINSLTAEQARRITAVCRTLGCPLIVDEIQTGSGRTGAFFAGSHIGLVGDYYTLAKSIGGGLAKTAVLMVRQSLYVKEFELLHSSTYAKDSFSCAITEKVIEMLERDGGAAYRVAAERGARLHDALEAVRADYPDVVASVRGRGLLAGFEFADQSNASSPVIRNYSRSGFFGFAVSGFLLRKHRLRLMPTGSAPHTLRIQPSHLIDDEGIDALAAGLREVCEVLRNQDAAHFVDALSGLGVRDFRSAGQTPAPAPAARRVAYVAAIGDPAELRRFDASLAALDDATLESFVTRSAPVRLMAPLPPVRWGSDVDVAVFPVLAGSKTPADELAGDVAMQSAAAAGFDAVVVSARLTGAPARTVDGPAGFALPAGIGDGEGVPAELAGAIG
jgi:acetylornithine/succinyldiaminopimelate/putrescine aminotransferase